MAESSGFFEKSKRGRGKIKHDILKYYLGCYTATVGQCVCYKRLIFIDGFAGPGQYLTKCDSIEEGSPLIAYQTVADHQFYDRFPQILLIFIEENLIYCKQLKKSLSKLKKSYKKANKNVDKIKTLIFCGNFEIVMKQILEIENYFSDPMLIFVDPFGIKGIPMKIMKRLVERPRTELIINVMFGSIIRWYGSPKHNKHFNQLLGKKNSEWKKTVFNEERPKSDDFIKYYLKMLREPGSKIHKFVMKDQQNRNIYQLIFITQNLTGFINMKRALNKMSQESQRFIYSEWVDAKIKQGVQPSLMSEAQILADVMSRILKRYQGTHISGSKIELFVWYRTPYIFNLKVQLKSKFKEYIVDKSIRIFNEITFEIP